LTFLTEFHADMSRYKEMRVHCSLPVTKTPTFRPPFCAPLDQDAKILTREIKVRPTCARKILSRSVKVNQSYSRKAGFEKNTYYEYNKRS